MSIAAAIAATDASYLKQPAALLLMDSYLYWGELERAAQKLCAKLPGYFVQRYLAESKKNLADMSLISAVIFVTILQHVYAGRPLEIPIKALAEYMLGETPLPLHDCGSCGVALPQSVKTCPSCGGAVGLSAFALRRGANAHLN
jgi:hypothetical protein